MKIDIKDKSSKAKIVVVSILQPTWLSYIEY